MIHDILFNNQASLETTKFSELFMSDLISCPLKTSGGLMFFGEKSLIKVY